jgi:8-oxo-dGTP pyrophosphatase MutT (NUDIX family)
MNFIDFSSIVSKIEKKELPGTESHFKMASAQRAKEIKVSQSTLENAKKAAVLAAFYPDKEGQTYLLFIKRQGGEGVHADQIAFPGGRAEDTDNDLAYTALREAEEEVGIRSKDMGFLKALTAVYIPPSNFLVQPYMGLYFKSRPFIRQVSEVNALLEVPLLDILDASNKQLSKLNTTYATDIEVPSFKFKDQIIWGATAMILNEIRWLLKEVL